MRELTDTGAALDGVEDLGNEVADSVLVDIVEESNGAALCDTGLEQLKRSVGLSRGVVLPVKGVDVGIDDMVAESLHDGEGVGVVAEVRRTHVGRPLSNNGKEVSLETGHLRADRGVGQGGKVGMAVTLGLLAYTRCYTTGE